jgi:hypothetical protein
MADYPHTDEYGHYIVDAHPIKTQVVITNPETDEVVYIPVKGFNWDKTTDMTPNLHSGSPLPSSLVDGHHNYKFTFETGTWLTTEVNKDNAEAWEYLAYTHLVRPFDSGRPRVFTIAHTQSKYETDGVDNLGKNPTWSGGHTIIYFEGCKINRMAYAQGENGINKRTYEGLAMRLTYGTGPQSGGKEQPRSAIVTPF